ncbi:MAG: hypothetical protein AMXMBFR64_29220 [Myxococcales bacterium]
MTTPDPAAVDFALKLARALHVHGAPAHRLEEAMTLVTGQLGMEGQFFSTPTSLLAGFGPLGEQRTYLLRVDPGGVDLEKQALLHDVVTEFSARRIDPDEASARIDAIEAAEPRYGAMTEILCAGLASGCAAVFFGGGVAEVSVGAGIGLMVGLIRIVATRWRSLGPIHEGVGALLAALLAALADHVAGPVSVPVSVLAGLVMLLPGLTLTTAMTELATRNLASGTARLASATVTFLMLGFGVALGTRLAELVAGVGVALEPDALPSWASPVALGLAPLVFAVLFRVLPRDIPWVLCGGFLAFYTARGGSALLGAELGLFLATLTLGLAANVWSRALERPSAVGVVPGMILLVPGSVGYRSLTSLMQDDVVGGVQTAFTVSQMAVALAAGLLVANALVAPRRAL